MKNLIDIGARRELFVDDFLIDRMEDVRLDLKKPERREIAFTADAPLRTTSSYTVTVSGAKDTAGNVMADHTFSFSIGAAEKVDWYTVQEGETLPLIAAKPEIYEDESQWMVIYEFNQDEYMSEDEKHGNDVILDYKNLISGMELYIPR